MAQQGFRVGGWPGVHRVAARGSKESCETSSRTAVASQWDRLHSCNWGSEATSEVCKSGAFHTELYYSMNEGGASECLPAARSYMGHAHKYITLTTVTGQATMFYYGTNTHARHLLGLTYYYCIEFVPAMIDGYEARGLCGEGLRVGWESMGGFNQVISWTSCTDS